MSWFPCSVPTLGLVTRHSVPAGAAPSRVSLPTCPYSPVCAAVVQYKVALVAFRLQFPAMFDKTSTAAMNLMTGLGVLYIFLSLVIATQLPGAWPSVFTAMAMFVWFVKTCECWRAWACPLVGGGGLSYWHAI